MKFIAVKKIKSIETQKEVPVVETNKTSGPSKEDLVNYIMPPTKRNTKVKVDSDIINEGDKQKTNYYSKEFGKEEPVDDDDEVGDGHEFDEDDHDYFELKTGGVFEQHEVLKIELPKFMIKTDIKDMNTVEDKSTIMLILAANETNQNIGKKVLRAVKNGFKEFKIELHDFDGDVASVWEFIGAKIKTVDLGALESHNRVEPRTIMCEIEYDNLVIDKEELI
jgi:hypothetical protein